MSNITFIVKLFNPETNQTAFVEFHNCENIYDPVEINFEVGPLWFPYKSMFNFGGHSRSDGLCSPNDFTEMAAAVGLEAEIL